MHGYKKIKFFLQSNWYIDDFVRKIVGKKYNNEMKIFVDELKNIKSVFSVDELFEKILTLPKAQYGTSYTFKRAFSENTLYGYAEQILRYASIPRNEIFYLPLLEHGILYENNLSTERYNINRPYIFQGKYLEESWKNIKRHKKAYYIGPYIHYASSIYTDEEMKKIKNKLGRTILLFLPHSTEYKKINFEIEDLLGDYIKKYRGNFDTVLLCVFWKDINENLLKSIDRNQYKICSAGFKLDPLFVCRLKSILLLADEVFYPTFSTSIGYAYYLKCKIIADVRNKYLEGNKIFEKFNKEFMKYFSMNSVCTNEERFEYIDKYWGISNIMTPKQIREIYFENKKNTIYRLGF